MEAKQINLNEWETFGGGGFGESFYNKTDDSVILKLNKTSVYKGFLGKHLEIAETSITKSDIKSLKFSAKISKKLHPDL